MLFDFDICLGNYIFKLNSLIPGDLCRPISLPLLLNIIYINLLYCLPCENFDMIRYKYFTGIWMARKVVVSFCKYSLRLYNSHTFTKCNQDLIIYRMGLYCIWKQLSISDIKIVMYHANKSHQSTKTVLFVAWARV